MTDASTAWAADRFGKPAAAENEEVELLSTPEFETPQPFTISLQHGLTRSWGNADFAAKLTYRVGTISRSVTCDWRGQASVIANQVRVSTVSRRETPFSPYSATGSKEVSYAVTVGLGAIAKNSVLYTSPTGHEIEYGSSDAKFIYPPDAATRLILRMAHEDHFNTAIESYFGLLRVQLLDPEEIPMHDEALHAGHFTYGLDLGNCRYACIVPGSPAAVAALPAGNLRIRALFELSL